MTISRDILEMIEGLRKNWSGVEVEEKGYYVVFSGAPPGREEPIRIRFKMEDED